MITGMSGPESEIRLLDRNMIIPLLIMCSLQIHSERTVVESFLKRKENLSPNSRPASVFAVLKTKSTVVKILQVLLDSCEIRVIALFSTGLN